MPRRIVVAPEDALLELERRIRLKSARQQRWRVKTRGGRVVPPPTKPVLPVVCAICAFPLVDGHHIRGREAGDGPDNLIPLCPNHHRMVHRELLSIVPRPQGPDGAADARQTRVVAGRIAGPVGPAAGADPSARRSMAGAPKRRRRYRYV